jgi:PAS domain S-box-containing protein
MKVKASTIAGREGAVGARNPAVPIAWAAGLSWPTAALALGYVALHLALDRVSFIGALHGIGITPWNPSAGLALALLILKGPRWAPLVLAAELCSELTVPVVPVSAVSVCLASLVVVAGYAGAAAVLRRVGLQNGIRRSRDVVALLVVMIVGSGLIAGGFVAIYAAARVVPVAGLAEAAFHFWIGDAIGMVVLAPPLLLLSERLARTAPPDQDDARPQVFEAAAQGASVIIALAAVFSGIGGDHPLGLFYLLFPPLIWIAVRHGLFATSIAMLAIQIGLIAGIVIQGHSGVALRGIQLLMLALAATGLMLGAVVSERRRLAQQLIDSERRRAAILNTARDGMLTVDRGGYIRSINPAVERLFAEPGPRLLGRSISEFIAAMPALLRRLQPASGSSVGEQDFSELEARRADGSTFPIEVSIGPFDPEGAEHCTIVIRDVTLRRQVEAQTRAHQAELVRVSRVSLAGEMAAGLAHELSQPLTAITAYARGCLRLLGGAAPEPALLQEGITEVVQQAERAGDVLDRLREFVRGGEHRRSSTEIGPLIDAVRNLVRAEAIQQGIEIEIAIGPDLPAVLADRIQIEQVLLNLLRNAIDAMATANAGQRSITVAARRQGSDAVLISVTDSGPGISPEVAGRLFEPFVTTKATGMGMGLSISRSIIEAHGGSLRLVRAGDRGAAFAFDLPTADLEAGHNGG